MTISSIKLLMQTSALAAILLTASGMDLTSGDLSVSKRCNNYLSVALTTRDGHDSQDFSKRVPNIVLGGLNILKKFNCTKWKDVVVDCLKDALEIIGIPWYSCISRVVTAFMGKRDDASLEEVARLERDLSRWSKCMNTRDVADVRNVGQVRDVGDVAYVRDVGYMRNVAEVKEEHILR